MKMPGKLGWWVFGGVAAAALVALTLALVLPLADWEDLIEQWVHDSGGLGILVFTGAYVVATLLLFPVAVLNVAAGALFGVYWGVAIVMAASTLAAVAAFLIARHLLRDRITRHFTPKDKRVAAIDKALRNEGWKAVALLRLSPLIPFAVKSYLLGVSRVRLRDYVIGTIIGKLPGAVVLVALGATGRAAMDLKGPERWGLLAAGIAATCLVTWLIGRSARRRLGLA